MRVAWRRSHSLAVLPGLGDIARVRVFRDHPAHLAVPVGGEEGSRLDQEAQTVVKGVAFLRPILREEAVAQGVIAHHVLDLQGPRQEGTRRPASSCSSGTRETPPAVRPVPLGAGEAWGGGGTNGDFEAPSRWRCCGRGSAGREGTGCQKCVQEDAGTGHVNPPWRERGGPQGQQARSGTGR